MQAGILTERIVIIETTEVTNEYGEPTVVSAKRVSRRAHVTVQNGRRALMNGEVWYPYAAIFKIRLDANINPTCIIEWNGQQYRCNSVSHDKHDMSTTINATLINE